MSEFLQLTQEGKEDDEVIEHFLAITRLDYRDMGKVLATYRSWPGPVFWACIVVLALIPVVAALAGSTPAARVSNFVLGVLPLILFGGPMVAINYFERHRICEHGLILGFRKKSKYVIPFTTIDPGRVRFAKRMGFLGRRPEIQQGPHLRIGFGCVRGVVLNGLDAAISSPWIDDDLRQVHTPFAWWMLGTRRADGFVRDLEEAMVADGYPARGLAARARVEGFTARWNDDGPNPIPPRMATDPVIGVHGPPLP